MKSGSILYWSNRAFAAVTRVRSAYWTWSEPFSSRVLQKYRGCRGDLCDGNLCDWRVRDAFENEYGGEVFVLVLATLAGGILTCVGAWPWFGPGAVLLAPFGAGSAAVFAGLLLAAVRSRHPAAAHKPMVNIQSEAPRAVANDTLSGQRRRA